MDSALADLKFLDSIFDPFFRRKAIRTTLAAIKEQKITGWEKWLQIELAVYLQLHPDVQAWGRESQYRLDKRIAKIRSKCAVDFIIQQKHKHTFLALEIKQLRSVSACVDGMLRDIAKMNKIRGKEFDVRSIWAIGIHNVEDKDDVVRRAVYRSSKFDVEIRPKHVVSKKIGRTGFSYTVL